MRSITASPSPASAPIRRTSRAVGGCRRSNHQNSAQTSGTPKCRAASVCWPSSEARRCSVPTSKQKTYADIFQQFGVSFGAANGNNAPADACPWCGKDRFYLNVTTGLYDCKKCGVQGNITTYLTWLHRAFLEKTTS